MEFGKYLGKGIWSIADKGLPVFYGVAYVVLVIKVLPEEEFGNFTLIQELFLGISGLTTAFALQPLLKFASEERRDQDAVLTSAFLMNIGFVLMSSLVVIAAGDPLSKLLKAPNLAPLMVYIPAMLGASLIRNLTLAILQSRFLVKQVFLVDAVHFIGTPALIYLYSKMNVFDSAFDLITISIISLSASSLMGVVVCRSMLRFGPPLRGSGMRDMWDYGRFSLGGIMSYLVYAKADSFILSAFGGPVQVAIYNSVKIFTRMYDMVSQVIQLFLLPATSRFASRGEFKTLKVVVEKAIAFSTLGMVPVFLLFLFLASPLISLIYGGRYTEGAPLLQLFSLLTFLIPVVAVSSNTLMGLGQAKASFMLSIQVLVSSLVIYLALIPLFGVGGAALGYVLSSLVMAWVTLKKMKQFVPVTLPEILRRTEDVRMFIKTRLARLP